jgi:hypothetical protein
VGDITGLIHLSFFTPSTADTSANVTGSPLGIFLFLIKSNTSFPTQIFPEA